MSIPKFASPVPSDVHGPFATALRRLAAASLTAASALLARLAVSLLESPVPSTDVLPHFEFHAEGGAPEGALYVDGELVGHLPRVTRL